MRHMAKSLREAVALMKLLATPYLRWIALQVLTCGLLFAFANVIEPIAYAVLFGRLESGNMDSIIKGCLLIGSVMLGMLGVQYLNDVVLDTNLFRAMNAISIESASRFHKQVHHASALLDEGDIYHRLYQGGRALPTVWLSIMMLVADTTSVIALIIACVSTSGFFSVAALLFVVAILLRTGIQARRAKSYSEQAEDAQGDIERDVYSVVHDMEFAVVNHMEDDLIRTYQKSRDRLWEIKKKEVDTERKISALYEAFDHLVRVFVPFLMLQPAGNRGISYGSVTANYSILDSLRANAGSLSGGAENVVKEFTPIERLSALLQASVAKDLPPNRQRPRAAAISVKNVTIYKDVKRILHEISFDIHTGEKVAIIGKNGSGKTTLLRAMLGLCSPDEGMITVDDTLIANAEYDERRSLISYAPSKSQVFSETIERNVLMGADGGEAQRLQYAASCACIDSSLLLQMGNCLSGGQEQRTNVARALIHKAPLLILDEPTASVDGHQSDLMIRAIASENATVVAVTHDPSLLHHFDRVIVISDQHVATDGTLEHIRDDNAFIEWHRATTMQERVEQSGPEMR